MNLFLIIFIFGFCVNLAYELCHSFLYETCRQASLKKYIYLMLKAALFDAFVITFIYWFTTIIFRNENIFYNYGQLAAFLVISLAIAFWYEKIALYYHRWEYATQMPMIFGVGLTPFIQLALTGALVLHFTFNLASFKIN